MYSSTKFYKTKSQIKPHLVFSCFHHRIMSQLMFCAVPPYFGHIHPLHIRLIVHL